jgi:hypothetical protein
MCDGVSLMAPAHDLHLVPSTFRHVMYAVFVIFTAGAAFGAVWIMRHSRDLLVRASTHTFMIQILFGAVVAMATVFPLLQDDSELFLSSIGSSSGSSSSSNNNNNSSATSNTSSIGGVHARVATHLNLACMSIPYFFFTGYGLIFIPLLLKTWRIRVLFDQKKIRKVVIPNSMLIKYEAVVMSFVMVILGLWTVTDPLHWERTILRFDAASRLPTESIGRCVCDSPMRFLAPLIVAIIASLIIGVYLSYVTRNAPVAFSEGKWIAVALVNILECFTLCTPILAITASQPQLDVIVKCMFVTLVCVGTTGIIFGPKAMVWMGAKAMSSADLLSGTAGGSSSPEPSAANNKAKVVPSKDTSSEHKSAATDMSAMSSVAMSSVPERM